MGIEGPGKDHHKRAKEAFEKADPNSYSFLPPQGDVEELGTARSRGGANNHLNRAIGVDDAVLYELRNDKVPARQQAAARLLKGIVNVADVVAYEEEGGTSFYSREMPLAQSEPVRSMSEVIADLEILNLIIDDIDHGISERDIYKPHHNLRTEDGRISYFDFDSAEFESSDTRLRKRHTRESLRVLKEKLGHVRERFAGSEGKEFIRAIYDATPEAETSLIPTFEAFYSVLEKRVERAEQLVEREIGFLEKEAA